MVTPPRYFTFDETGERASLHIEWHGLRFTRTSKLARMRHDLEQFAPDMVELFEQSYQAVKEMFIPNARPLTPAEIEEATS